MEIIFTKKDGVTIIAISGNLDGTTAPDAQEKIFPVITPECRLVFDMKECGYISSAGLRILLMFAKQIAKIGGKGALIGLSEEINEVMKMTGFEHVFHHYETISQAKEAFRKGQS